MLLKEDVCYDHCIFLAKLYAAAAKSLQSCLTLFDPIDGSPPGSSVPGILQARIQKWVATSFSNACMPAKTLQLCPTLCNPMDSSPPGSSVHGLLQARILEWVAISLSQFICKVVLFSGVWQSDSVLYIYIYILLYIYFRFFSVIVYYKMLNTLPRALQ